MQNAATVSASSEPQFAATVDALAADAGRREQLTELLREDHPVYKERGAATVVRMRGWVLLAMARAGLSDSALIYVLEELDAGTDGYLVAAAARALRSYPAPNPDLAPFVARSLNFIHFHDEPLSFDGYGEYALSSADTSPVRELLATLEWLGPHARGVLPELEELRAQRGGFSRKLLADFDRALEAIRGTVRTDGREDHDSCCALPAGLGDKFSWARALRRGGGQVERVTFEDQDGATLTFGEFFRGRPSVVVFFYTRCDNPLKCSLTVSKLARVQKLLEERGLAERVRTAGISYDPGFDLPHRLRVYGQNRSVKMDAGRRLLRATDGFDELRSHFKLGVNFIGSLVNRHRIELYILDAEGRVAASFERIHWDEQQVVERVVEVLAEGSGEPGDRPEAVAVPPSRRKASSPVLGTLASLGVAFFPKCPICWAGYLSLFGVAGLQRIPYSPWLQMLLVAMMLVNVASVWLRGRATGRMSGFYLVSAGALIIIASRVGPGWESAAVWGVALTLAGSLLGVLGAGRSRPVAQDRATAGPVNYVKLPAELGEES
jgi:protein SCO1/2